MEKNQAGTEERRVIGLDCHPDSFTAGVLRGPTPAAAITEKVFNKVPISRLMGWAKKHTRAGDVLVLEASGNSFQIARTLRKLALQTEVLESTHLGKLKEAHANNDRISAVRIGKAYMAGTAKKVWVPDEKTQDRRDWMHAHRKAVKRTTQMRNRLLCYLSDNGVRLPKGTRLARDAQAAGKLIESSSTWSNKQRQVIQIMLSDLQHAEQQRTKWRSLIAQEIAGDDTLLSFMRLCGVREIVAFALGALIGDINRFARPKALVNYIGLSPAFDDSGKKTWEGGVGGRGRKDLRNLLMEAAHSILRSKHPMTSWARQLLARKGSKTLVIAAVARKLAVSIWYLMKGQWTALQEVDPQLGTKISKIITTIGADVVKAQGLTRKKLREQLDERLKNGRVYQLKDIKMTPTPAAA